MSLGYEKAAEIGHSPERAYSLGDVVQVMGNVRHAMESVIEGKRSSVDLALVVLLAEGHLLVEDVPGVGKTMLAKALGRSIACSVRQVSVDGTTYRLESPFMVVATQNPIEMEGTYPLPEAQRDRFMARIQMGYPTPSAELDMLESHGTSDPLAELRPVTDGQTIRGLIDAVKTVYLSPAVKHYLVQVVNATRNSRDLRLGASPRATLHLLRASRAFAALSGRDYVSPDDVAALAVSVLAHRVLPSTDAQLARHTVNDIIAHAVTSVHIPDRR